jgi:hypothetical protein
VAGEAGVYFYGFQRRPKSKVGHFLSIKSDHSAGENGGKMKFF